MARRITAWQDEIVGLPGADLVGTGLSDLAQGRASAEVALVEVASGLLRDLDLLETDPPAHTKAAELRLYERIAARYPDRDSYPLYCAWLEQLDSFCRARRTSVDEEIELGQ